MLKCAGKSRPEKTQEKRPFSQGVSLQRVVRCSNFTKFLSTRSAKADFSRVSSRLSPLNAYEEITALMCANTSLRRGGGIHVVSRHEDSILNVLANRSARWKHG